MKLETTLPNGRWSGAKYRVPAWTDFEWDGPYDLVVATITGLAYTVMITAHEVGSNVSIRTYRAFLLPDGPAGLVPARAGVIDDGGEFHSTWRSQHEAVSAVSAAIQEDLDDEWGPEADSLEAWLSSNTAG